MKGVPIISNYISWYYTRTPKKLIDTNIKFANFILNFFSVPHLLNRLLFIWLDILKKVLEKKDLAGVFSTLFLYSFIGAIEATFIILIISIAFFIIITFSFISVLSLGTWFAIPALLIILPLSALIAFLF